MMANHNKQCSYTCSYMCTEYDMVANVHETSNSERFQVLSLG